MTDETIIELAKLAREAEERARQRYAEQCEGLDYPVENPQTVARCHQ